MRGVPVARLFGIEVQVPLAWVFVLALVGALAAAQLRDATPGLSETAQWILAALVALGFFASAVAHDLAHALVARRRGLSVSAVVVSFFGGAAPDEPTAGTPADDLAIAVAGPVVSLVVGSAFTAAALGLAAPAGPVGDVLAPLLGVLGVLNLLLGGINLVPAYPLDGGRIVRDIAWRRAGDQRRGWTVAALVGRLTAFVMLGAGAVTAALGDLTNGAFIALTGWFLFLSARAIAERVKVDALIGDLTIADAMERDLPSVGPGLTIDTFAAQLLGDGSPTTVVPVLGEDGLVGVIGVGQVRGLRASAWPTTRVEAVMLRPPRMRALAPAESLLSGYELIRRARADGLPVVGPDGLVGMLTLRSIGAAVRARRESGGAGRAVEGAGAADERSR